MTLIDTVVGFTATLDALAAELGVELPVVEMSSKLGPPLDLLLEPHLPADEIEAAVDRFRELYPDIAIGLTPAFSGAAAALAAVRRHGGRVVLVTGKHTPNAQLHVDHLALDVDVVEGRVWGVGKGEVLRRHEADVFVGDHVHDVDGARAAGVVSVSVLTGGCTREELAAAGTDVVLDDLAEFPGWLDGFVLAATPRRAGRAAAPPRAAAGRLQRRSGQRLPAGSRGARARSRPRRGRHGVLRLVAARPSASRRWRSPARSGWRCSRRARPRWSGRATAPTRATGAPSASPSCSRCSARWPPSDGYRPSRPAPTPMTPPAASGPGSRPPPPAERSPPCWTPD